MKYTVKTVTATGKVDPKYGSEYLVTFNEDSREVKMSRQKPVSLGQEENGTIIDGKFGAYFKKDPFVATVDAAPSSTQESAPSAKSYGRAYKDNSDGMRQGMCMNNAAEYVKTHSTELVDPEVWASTVHKYASALYTLGDLVVIVPPATEPVVVPEPDNMGELYGNK